MGTYVYKVTGERVALENGEMASVFVFAYKPWRGFDPQNEAANARMHFRTGCTTTDRFAEKREPWVVHGSMDAATGHIKVSAGSPAYRLRLPMGSFVGHPEEWAHEVEKSAVAAFAASKGKLVIEPGASA